MNNERQTTQCESEFCDREVPLTETVDVVAGTIVENDNTVSVAGVDIDSPETRYWCSKCAKREFDIEKNVYRQTFEQANRYITAKTVAAFALGVTLMLIISSVMVV